MKLSYFTVVILLAAAFAGCSSVGRQPEASPGATGLGGGDKHPLVIITTSMGPIVVRLDAERAPISVRNFLTYVESGFYTGTVFHRVIPGFMIQGGGLEAGSLRRKSTRLPIINEYGNGLRNTRGTIAMARTSELNSATSQFYINLVDNSELDRQKYAVFGEVVIGMETVDRQPWHLQSRACCPIPKPSRYHPPARTWTGSRRRPPASAMEPRTSR